MSEEMKEMLFIEESAEINESAFEALKEKLPHSAGCYILHIEGSPESFTGEKNRG